MIEPFIRVFGINTVSVAFVYKGITGYGKGLFRVHDFVGSSGFCPSGFILIHSIQMTMDRYLFSIQGSLFKSNRKILVCFRSSVLFLKRIETGFSVLIPGKCQSFFTL